MKLKSLILTILFVLIGIATYSQNISGFIQDSTNAGIPFVNVYVKNLGAGTTTDAEGKYFLRFDDPGLYQLVVSAVGYETHEIQILFKSNEDINKNIWLEIDQNELEEVIVNSKKRDPAYGIIAEAVKNKSRWVNQYESITEDVYIKAKENISEKERKKRKKKAEQQAKTIEESDNVDIFDQEKKKKQAEINKIAFGMNMVEIKMKRHFQSPNKIKEIREGYKKLGSSYGLFYTNTSEAVFNFYDNLMSLETLNELPVVSPLHFTSVLTYKFKLVETTVEDEHFVYKIKVTPRKAGNATWSGHIWIDEGTFHLRQVDLSLSKGGLLIYNDFNIKQEYFFHEDSILLLKSQEFNYQSKGGSSIFKGNTLVTYENPIINPTFEKRYFKNEVAVTTQEAYDKDSSYWDKIRPEPLTSEEQKYQRIKDSIYAYTHSDHYLDSLDSVFNKITVLDALWDGFEFTNRKKQQNIYISSVAGLLDPFEIGGLRVGPDFSYFKKWKNEKYFYFSPGFDIGLRNMDLKYDIGCRGRYDPMHAGYAGFWTGKMFNTIVENDALSNLFLRSNWIEENRFTFFTSREIFNGLYLYGNYQYVDRYAIDGYKFGDITTDWFDGQNVPLSFENYQSSILSLDIEYTPFQKYMTEPYRKVVLGSKWPTFSIYGERGVPKLFRSDIDYTYFTASIRQSFKLGTLGTSSYKIKGGKFTNTKDLRYVDQKIFPRGDQWFFASLMESMQIQDTTLTVSDGYYQIHYTHHFNGAIVNYIPYVKKLGIHAVVGVSTLYIKESSYQYYEGFVGLEKTFKVQRSRIRVGIYFVEAQSNFSRIPPRIKFAVNRYSLRDKSWGY